MREKAYVMWSRLPGTTSAETPSDFPFGTASCSSSFRRPCLLRHRRLAPKVRRDPFVVRGFCLLQGDHPKPLPPGGAGLGVAKAYVPADGSSSGVLKAGHALLRRFAAIGKMSR